MCCNSPPTDLAKVEVPNKTKLSRIARRCQNKELAQKQKEAKATIKALKEEELEDLCATLENFRLYTVRERKLVFTKADRNLKSEGKGVHDAPTIFKKIDLF